MNLLNEYLAVTNDEYAVVKFTGKSKLILEEDETDSLGAVEFSSLDYDVVQDYEGDAVEIGRAHV